MLRGAVVSSGKGQARWARVGREGGVFSVFQGPEGGGVGDEWGEGRRWVRKEGCGGKGKGWAVVGGDGCGCARGVCIGDECGMAWLVAFRHWDIDGCELRERTEEDEGTIAKELYTGSRCPSPVYDANHLRKIHTQTMQGANATLGYMRTAKRLTSRQQRR